MRHKFITKNRTFQGRLVFALIGVGLAIVLTERLDIHNTFMEWGPILAVVLWLCLASYLGHRRVKQREALMERYVAAHQVDWLPDGPSWNGFVHGLGAIDSMHNARDRTVKNVLQGPDWMYGDFSYNLYGKISMVNI